MRVCLDNNILIWAIRQECTPGQEHMLARAKALLDNLQGSNADIMIPAVVLTEFLAYIPKDNHNAIISIFNQHFQIYPFDANAAKIAARIWRESANGNPSLKNEIQNSLPNISRVRIKADTMILATALSSQAEVLYTHDKGLSMLAKNRITLLELPLAAPQQGEFFET